MGTYVVWAVLAIIAALAVATFVVSESLHSRRHS